MVKTFLAALAVASAQDIPATMPFDDWMQTFGQTYNSDEELTKRKEIYSAKVAWIEEENKKDLGYTLGVNQFSALTEEEMLAQATGAIPPEGEDDSQVFLGMHEEVDVPESSIDWTRKGVVNAVKNQGGCGSCWAFATMSSIESGYAIKSGKLLNLAEQQLVDCDRSDAGCGGGWPYRAMQHFQSHGACTTSSYPYKAKGGTCQENRCSTGFRAGVVSGYKKVATSASGLKSALNGRTVTVTVDAGGAFGSYRGGILKYGCKGRVNHAITAVGYVDGSHFLIRNSWGSRWGENGYVRIAMDGTACLFQQQPSYPVISAEEDSIQV